MQKTILRKTFSVLLALTLMLTSFCIADPSSLFPTASASVSTANSDDLAPVTFIVPEAIYLTPTWDCYTTNREMSFQWYVNNKLNADGSVSCETGEDSVGDIYFNYADADSVKIKFEWLDEGGVSSLGGRITFGDGTERSAGGEYTTVPSNNAMHITSGMSPALDSTVTGAFLRWTATFLDKSDSRNKTVTAYTYVYKPYPQAVGAAIRSLNERGTDSNGDSLCWVSGVHDIDNATRGAYYPSTALTSEGKGLMTFSSSYNAGVKVDRLYAQFASENDTLSRFAHTGFADLNPYDWLNNTAYSAVPDMSFNYLDNVAGGSSGDYSVGAVTFSPTAILTVDTSRYTNLNQIPNLSVGMMVTRDKASANGGAWFVADYTGTPTADIIRIEEKNGTSAAEAQWSNYASGNMLASAGHYSNDTANNKGWAPSAEVEGVKYNGRWTRAVGESGLYMVSTGYFNHDSNDSTDHYGGDTIWNFSELRTQVRAIDKSFLRSAVLRARTNAAALNSTLYDTSSTFWKDYTSLYHAANLALTKLDGDISVTANVGDRSVEYTTAEAIATALDTAVTNLLNGNGRAKGTVTQTNVALQRLENGSYKCVELLGGNSICSASYVSGQAVSLSPENCPGYTFVGVLKTQIPPTFSVGAAATYPSAFTTSSAGAVFSEDGTVTYPRAGTAGTDNRGNIYYTFYYVPNNYTVTFNANGGTGASTQQSFIYNDPQALNANTFTKRGYDFAGWATNPEGTGTVYEDKAVVNNLTTQADGNVDLYAVWTQATYTMTFDPTGGTIVGDYDTTYTIESTIVLPNAVKDGLTLTGWKANNAGNWGPLSYTAGTPLAPGKYGDVTMYAEWKANDYAISFNGNGATSGSMANQQFTYGTAQALSANAFVRTGYSFLGWAATATATQIQYSDKQIVLNLTAVSGTTIPLYAVWSPNTYSISYNTDGGTILDTGYSKTYTIESPITLPARVEKSGYSLLGWESTTNAGNWTTGVTYTGTIGTGMYGGVTFTAQWSLTSYTILYNTDGGTISGSGYTTAYNTQTTIVLPSAQKTGYRLAGWVANDGGNWGTETYAAGSVGAGMYGNVTLKALWSGITYYISFDGNRSTAGSMPIQSMVYGQSAALNSNVFTRTGYRFIGWSTTNNASTATYQDGETVQNLSSVSGTFITLYAVWSASAYTISYDVAGGVIAGSAQTSYTISEAVYLPTPTRDGYSFDGWKPTESVGGWSAQTIYSGKLEVGTVYGSVSLVAQWTVETYTITYDTNGGSITGNATFSYDITSTVTLPVASRSGRTFLGWQASGWDNGIYPSGNYTEKFGNVTMTALWEVHNYSVRFHGNGAASGSMPNQTLTIDTEEALTANAFARPGFSFTGWALTQSGSPVYADGAEVLNLTYVENDVVDLYACWNGMVFSLVYDLNGISGSMLATSVTMEGSAVTLRENKLTEIETAEKYLVFSGWAFSKADADNGVVALENMASFSLKESDLATLNIDWSGSRPTIRLYAVWTEVEIAASIDAENSKAVVDAETGFIYGLKLGITEQELVDEYIEVIGKAHLELDYIGFVGTGTVVRLVSDVTGEVLETYTVVIFGDLNGDGDINNQDIVAAKALAGQIVEYDMTEATAFAADLFTDGDINNSDLSILKALQNGNILLDQATREQIVPA